MTVDKDQRIHPVIPSWMIGYVRKMSNSEGPVSGPESKPTEDQIITLITDRAITSDG